MMMLVWFSGWALATESSPDAQMLDTAAQLMGQALASEESYDELVELCDTIGHRVSGSPELAQAVSWSAAKMAEDGLTVIEQPVEVPRWVRGTEQATLLAPMKRSLEILTLGSSVGTSKKGLTADVIVVSSFEEFEALPNEAVAGKMVLWDVPWDGYGKTVAYRVAGASRAAEKGAVASLVSSVTSDSLYTAHTGNQRYDEGVTKIPAVAVTREDAGWLGRVIRGGETVTLKLQLGAHFEDDVLSHNVIGEIKGREKPDEYVVVGCHLDSWDVGQGAQDDGAGCTAAMHAGALIAALPQAPRRSVRVVLFTNEENGLRGGTAYAEEYGSLTHVGAIEMDTGGGPGLGFRVDVRTPEETAETLAAQAIERLAPIQALLARIDAGELFPAGSGADISPLVKGGVLGLGLHQDTTGYWPIHHTKADTVEKIDPKDQARNVALLTVMTYALAEMSETPL